MLSVFLIVFTFKFTSTFKLYSIKFKLSFKPNYRILKFTSSFKNLIVFLSTTLVVIKCLLKRISIEFARLFYTNYTIELDFNSESLYYFIDWPPNFEDFINKNNQIKRLGSPAQVIIFNCL